MRRLPQFCLLIAATLIVGGCSSDSEAPDPPDPAPSPDGITELDKQEAIKTFEEVIDAELELEIAAEITGGLRRQSPDGDGLQYVWILPDQASPDPASALMAKLQLKLGRVKDSASWIPWERLIDTPIGGPGPSLGSYETEDGRITLWVDRHASTLFLCHQPRPKASAAPQ